MSSLYEDWKTAKYRYEACKGATISNSFRKLDFTYKAMRSNTLELKKFFEHCESGEGQLHVHLAFFDQDKRDEVLVQLYRLLLNYCASAMALVDHTRNVYIKLLQGGQYLEEYKQKVGSDLACKGHMQFIQKLRNYFLHYQSSGTNYSLGWKKGKSNTPFYLESQTLLRWNNWSAISKEYILNQGDQINIKETINLYNDSVYEFLAWLDGKHATWFEEEFREMEEFYKVALDTQEKLKKA